MEGIASPTDRSEYLLGTLPGGRPEFPYHIFCHSLNNIYRGHNHEYGSPVKKLARRVATNRPD